MKDVPGVGTRKRTRLAYAVHVNDLERVRFLLARGARVNKANLLGSTPLYFARSREVVRELCAKGADMNATQSIDGSTALMWASLAGQPKIVRELCERGCQCECYHNNY